MILDDMVQGWRCTILKLVLIVVIVIAVDQTFRKRVLLSPGWYIFLWSRHEIDFICAGEVVEKYMIKVGLHIEEGSSEVKCIDGLLLNPKQFLKEFPVRVRRHCEERRERHEAQQYYFYIKSKIEGRKNLLLCVPPRMASKQAFDLLSQIYDGPCPDGRLRSCAVEPQFQPDNNTLTAVLVRHPFDRLIIDYKHQKYSTEPRVDGETHIPGRKILFSRHRARQGRRKNKREFREFIKSQVLSDNSSIYSVSQVSETCIRNNNKLSLCYSDM